MEGHPAAGALTALSVFVIIASALLASCSSPEADYIDNINDKAYQFHYRDLDSTLHYARLALDLASREGYEAGQAEALNNMAFVSTMRMSYAEADSLLEQACTRTANQVELLVANVQRMRLCQRMARNREFYEYGERAKRHLERILEEPEPRRGDPLWSPARRLSPHLTRRLTYAETEYAIVSSTYYYYVGLFDKSAEAMAIINPEGAIRSDTAQLLNYMYNVGSGGVIVNADNEARLEQELEHLSGCLSMARRAGYKFFEANALGDLSLRLLDESQAEQSRSMAEESLRLFIEYGDAYQIGAARRRLASCLMSQGDYEGAHAQLLLALDDPRLEQSPALCSSLREQMSVACSALGDKQQSDYNRNIYLDLHDLSRQDRYYEARAAQLAGEVGRLSLLSKAVVGAIIIMLVLLWLLTRAGRRRDRDEARLAGLMEPLEKWRKTEEEHGERARARMEELGEAQDACRQRIRDAELTALENRCKIVVAAAVVPYIDRIINELKQLEVRPEPHEKRQARMGYIAELVGQIDKYNKLLAYWIQMRQGRLSLKIESFPIDYLFRIVAGSKSAFQMKGVELNVEPSRAIVKADRVLTLFMINTLADNARKFTPEGGRVSISAREEAEWVEISVEDNGEGFADGPIIPKENHGFGLMNCRGIIERYRKTSRKFEQCSFNIESEKGRGSRVSFRLPKGVMRVLIALLSALSPIISGEMKADEGHRPAYSSPMEAYNIQMAANFADSAYYANIEGQYENALRMADSCRLYLNLHYRELAPDGHFLMQASSDNGPMPAEIVWLRDSLPTDYDIILDIRNESAVAALALREWDVYEYNNDIFNRLYKELSADTTLEAYCNTMLRAQTDRYVALIILITILLMIIPAYYILYYRPRRLFRIKLESLKRINAILDKDSSPTDKLKEMSADPRLAEAMGGIGELLARASESSRRQEDEMEMAEDEVRRLEAEAAMLHISNSVVDNGLSALKHETMYYPDRIRMLIEKMDGADADADLSSIREIAEYYRNIYSMLMSQAASQMRPLAISAVKVEDSESKERKLVMANAHLLNFMLETLRKQTSSDEDFRVDIRQPDAGYVMLTVSLGSTDADPSDLFTPKARNIPFLLCRQVVRDLSEKTNRRRCGLVAKRQDSGNLSIEITLPSAQRTRQTTIPAQ